MAEFIKYQHIERFGNTEVAQIELGECFVFPKIDGTNASVWHDSNNGIQAGSRNRQLSLERDNAGFYKWVLEQQNLSDFFKENPDLILYGEWLVPHSLKTYKENAWRKFYVFDVATPKQESEIVHDSDDKVKHLHYNEYKELLESYGIDYIPPICVIKNGSYEQFVHQLQHNVFLIEDGQGAGEGIVVKNYAFKSKYNRQTWAKIITSEFKEKHWKAMGATNINGTKMVEEEIVNKYVTTAMCDKVYRKIELEEQGWSSKFIPRLLNSVFYDLIKEECWEFVKEFKNPTINFNTLKHFALMKTKEHLPQLF